MQFQVFRMLRPKTDKQDGNSITSFFVTEMRLGPL